MEYVIINGEIVKKDEAILTSFFWNDPLFITEKVWFGFGGIPLFDEKLDKLSKQLQIIGAITPPLFLNQREFFRRIKRMLNKNRFYRSGLIHFQLLIAGTETNFVLYATPFEQSEFRYHDSGILIRFAENHKFSKSSMLFADNFTRIFDQVAFAMIKEPAVQGFIFLNEKGLVCDAGLSNVFFVKKNTLLTPSLATGCIPDHLRKLIIEAAVNLHLQIIEPEEIIPETVSKMDEIFFAGEVTGIQWVLGIDTKRFVHPVSAQIHNEMNKILFNKVH